MCFVCPLNTHSERKVNIKREMRVSKKTNFNKIGFSIVCKFVHDKKFKVLPPSLIMGLF